METKISHDGRALQRLKTHNWLLGEPKLLAFFEIRHRGIELWKKARLHFQSKSTRGLKEALDEELLHKGSAYSKLKRTDWTVHPNSWLKLAIYFVKLLSLLYNFFFIAAM